MLKKLLILTFIIGSSMSQTPHHASCDFEVIKDICICNFLISNPNGFNNLTIGGNSLENCTFENVKRVFSTGTTTNIPNIICESFPELELLQMNDIGVKTLADNPFQSCGKLKTLSLKKNFVSDFIAYTLSNTNLESLDLSYNSLTNLDQYAFNRLKSLQILHLEGNSGISLPDNIFRDLENLLGLNIRNCNLQEIKTSWFQTLRNVRTLLLSDNEFTTIPSGAFSNLVNLNRLEISNCKISSLNANNFVNNRNLKFLFLNNNKLELLPENLFRNQSILETLDLSYNELTNIPSSLFQPLISMQNLNLTKCNISKIEAELFSSMTNLDTIDLSGNFITEIPWHTFTATNLLRNLYIENNNIITLDARSFGSLVTLNNLWARNNKIDEIDHHFMNQSAVKEFVRLEENECTQLSTDDFNRNKTLNMDAMKMCFDNFDKKLIELMTYNSTIFDWHNIRPNDGWEAIKVRVKAYENVRIGLVDSLSNENPLVEVRIGERDNHESHIFERGQRVFLNSDHFPLDETQTRTFIIGWHFGIVMVFRVNERFPFMAHAIQQRFPVNFFGLRTEINTYNSENNAEWNVSRINGNEVVQLRNAYRLIEAKLKSGLPINLKAMLMKN